MTTTVSVVVPSRNSARTIAACLESVRAQRGVVLELIVVDNHSDDGTFEIARRYADQVILGGPERSAQRNTGVRLSRGEWICWIDSDMVLPPETLGVALAAAQLNDVRTVAIPETSFGAGYWTACRALERRCYLGDVGLHNPRLLRRDLFREIGGFGESMAGPEDADLRLRLRAAGEPIGYARSVLIAHDEGRLSLRTVWAKRVYYGRSLPALTDAHPRPMTTQCRELVLAYWRNRRLLLDDPRHLVGLLVLRTVEAVGYLAGAARGYDARRTRAGESVR